MMKELNVFIEESGDFGESKEQMWKCMPVYAILFMFLKIANQNCKEDLSMAVSNIKATFQSDIQKVWEVVTSLKNYSWRSDLSKIEIINENQFVEYTKEGYATTFTITVQEPYKRWEFDIENDNIKGHWTGIFSEKDGQTEIDFTEDVIAKKVFMKPFVKAYLKKQQALYISDLQKAL